MGLLDEIADLTEKFLEATTDALVGRPRLIYQVGFADAVMAPFIDTLQLGLLKESLSSNLASIEPFTPRREVVFPSGDMPAGIRFTLERPPEVPATETISVGAVVNPFPNSIKKFRIEATFSVPAGPRGPTDAWATVLLAREGGVIDAATRDTRIAVTLQSAFDTVANIPGARMNTVGGAPPGAPEPYISGAGSGRWLLQWVYTELFDPPSAQNSTVFKLSLTVDRHKDAGHASLDVGGINVPEESHMYGEDRAFDHPFLDPTSADIGTVGLAIAVASGNGPASVTVHDFRIYDLWNLDWTYWLAPPAWMGAGARDFFVNAREWWSNRGTDDTSREDAGSPKD